MTSEKFQPSEEEKSSVARGFEPDCGGGWITANNATRGEEKMSGHTHSDRDGIGAQVVGASGSGNEVSMMVKNTASNAKSGQRKEAGKAPGKATTGKTKNTGFTPYAQCGARKQTQEVARLTANGRGKGRIAGGRDQGSDLFDEGIFEDRQGIHAHREQPSEYLLRSNGVLVQNTGDESFSMIDNEGAEFVANTPLEVAENVLIGTEEIDFPPLPSSALSREKEM